MLIILTALQCEATPIISQFRLKKSPHINAFQVYQNENICLVITGIGKIATASAIGFIHAWQQSSSLEEHTHHAKASAAWLNVGIAGHSHLEIGDSFLATKIIECSTQKTFYPPLSFKLPSVSSDLYTVDLPDDAYLNEGGVDMEASAFYATASRFSTGELVQSYKVISDNKQTPVRKFSKQEVTGLINNKLSEIEFIAAQLLLLNDEVNSHAFPLEIFNHIIKNISLTHSQTLQVKSRIHKLSLLTDNIENTMTNLEKYTSGTELLQTLDVLINDQKVSF